MLCVCVCILAFTTSYQHWCYFLHFNSQLNSYVAGILVEAAAAAAAIIVVVVVVVVVIITVSSLHELDGRSKLFTAQSCCSL